jgi:integrase
VAAAAKLNEGIRQLERGRWLVRVRRVDSRTRKVVNRKATIAGTKADALHARDRIRAELASSSSRPLRKTLAEFAAEWLARRRVQLKGSVARKYEFSLRHVRAALGALWLDAIAPSHIEEYVARRTRAGAAGNTVLNELRMLRTIARDSLAEGYAVRYWCDRVRPPRVRRYTEDDPNLLTPDQAARVLARVPRHWIGLVFLLMTTGLRIGEATALRWGDLRHDVARVRRGNDRGALVEPKTKGSYRDVPALLEVVALFGRPRGDDELVFPSRRGGLHRGSPLRSVLEKACAAAGVPRVTTHGLRRTFNDAGRRRGSREALMAITGHVTDEMVSHYSIADAGEKASISRAVALAIGVPSVSDDPTKNGGKS